MGNAGRNRQSVGAAFEPHPQAPQALSEKSNVSYGSIKRFETTGQISLNSLTKLCVALDCADEIKNLFTNVEYGSIEEVIRERT